MYYIPKVTPKSKLVDDEHFEVSPLDVRKRRRGERKKSQQNEFCYLYKTKVSLSRGNDVESEWDDGCNRGHRMYL